MCGASYSPGNKKVQSVKPDNTSEFSRILYLEEAGTGLCSVLFEGQIVIKNSSRFVAVGRKRYRKDQ